MLRAVLSVTTHKDVAVSNGVILVFFLFITLVLWGLTFTVVTTLGQVSGLYERDKNYSEKRYSDYSRAPSFQAYFGLESNNLATTVHCELKNHTKMFLSCLLQNSVNSEKKVGI